MVVEHVDHGHEESHRPFVAFPHLTAQSGVDDQLRRGLLGAIVPEPKRPGLSHQSEQIRILTHGDPGMGVPNRGHFVAFVKQGDHCVQNPPLRSR